jgi:hypothetical protein
MLVQETIDNGALLRLDMSNNGINANIHGGAAAAPGKALADALAANTVLTELNLSSNCLKPEFARELSVGIRDNGALLRLDMSNNKINYCINGEAAAVPGKALSDALAANTVLTELNLSSNFLKPEFARELSVGISNNGAISTVIVHKFPLPIQDIKTKAELDLSGKELNHLDAIIIAALLPLNVSRALFGYLYYR